MREELARFVESLAIPADRKAIVLAELLDHLACATEAAARDGLDPEAAVRTALGDLEVLRRSLEAIEPAFQLTMRAALARGFASSLLIAFAIDRGGVMMGPVGALVAIAIAVVLAPPLALLRAELRAPRIRGALGRGLPIGPALAYAVTVMYAPFAIWIVLIVTRTYAGVTDLETPMSAFAAMIAMCLMLFVESIRARRGAVA